MTGASGISTKQINGPCEAPRLPAARAEAVGTQRNTQPTGSETPQLHQNGEERASCRISQDLSTRAAAPQPGRARSDAPHSPQPRTGIPPRDGHPSPGTTRTKSELQAG